MNYYNEYDVKAAAWLKQLIAAGCIPPGIVDTRSITEVMPSDLAGFTQCHFFAGIGGWSLALKLAGWRDDEPVWTGSCPCQPYSVAGIGDGDDDPRALWWAFRWLILNRNPARVLGEQVASKAGRGWLAGVRADMEALGYGFGAGDLCAAGVAAPHIRQRLYWMADATGNRQHGSGNFGPTGRFEPSNRCYDSRLADAAGADSWCGQLGFQQNGGSNCWTARECEQPSSSRMADAESERRFGNGGVGEGSAHVLVGGNSPQWATRGVESQGLRHDSRLGHTDQQGPQGRPTLPECRSERAFGAAGMGRWGNTWIPCGDGKARRIEPGLAPLVDGFPGRVGLVRGYGNAIVPPLAAEFIAACMEVLGI